MFVRSLNADNFTATTLFQTPPISKKKAVYRKKLPTGRKVILAYNCRCNNQNNENPELENHHDMAQIFVRY